jgi:hypothetical protein
VESSATYAGHEGATSASDGEFPMRSMDEGMDEGSPDPDPDPTPTLEVAMQRLAETIKEFDAHSAPKLDQTTSAATEDNNNESVPQERESQPGQQ